MRLVSHQGGEGMVDELRGVITVDTEEGEGEV
jgi:hypothetical protein